MATSHAAPWWVTVMEQTDKHTVTRCIQPNYIVTQVKILTKYNIICHRAATVNLDKALVHKWPFHREERQMTIHLILYWNASDMQLLVPSTWLETLCLQVIANVLQHTVQKSQANMNHTRQLKTTLLKSWRWLNSRNISHIFSFHFIHSSTTSR